MATHLAMIAWGIRECLCCLGVSLKRTSHLFWSEKVILCQQMFWSKWKEKVSKNIYVLISYLLKCFSLFTFSLTLIANFYIFGDVEHKRYSTWWKLLHFLMSFSSNKHLKCIKHDLLSHFWHVSSGQMPL